MPPQGMIHTLKTESAVYSLSWSPRLDRRFRVAYGTFTEDKRNKISVTQLNEHTGEFNPKGEAEHGFPPTKIQWIPDKNGKHPELLASSGDYLYIWEQSEAALRMKSALINNKSSEFCAPLTSLDWNEHDPTMIGTASIDTTCTIWNIETGQPKTQLIAHDKEVFDIAFGKGVDNFASVGADGSVRMFDLRNLDHSTIMYESNDSTPLLRLAWNKQDPNYLATFMLDSPKLIIIDVRAPSEPVSELMGHTAPLNAFAWAPHSAHHVCTTGDDSQALVWDISKARPVATEPVLAYRADAEINNLVWSSSQNDWVAVAFDNKVQLLRV